ncbi:hypothetical protein [Mesorhizobium onobrychidis]|uniref:Uncharacterized protein n=1 Tax=Mesorhizobium onobrychidis TaxID=2775404 RepID=A0ABY5QVD2_9HYPH|nr:hypothetical protein [Mesorhizobium onobrychidis]UVC15166.1 hypothetical protein IHQ72_32095 [Mesorhizobium onobrychidis]
MRQNPVGEPAAAAALAAAEDLGKPATEGGGLRQMGDLTEEVQLPDL